jgi:hypothetical protein
MKSLILIISTTLIMTACQTGSHRTNQRTVASSKNFTNFLRMISAETTSDAAKIEKSIISYIQRHDDNLTHGNYELMGLTKEEANRIKSLSDDLPYIGKVQRWAMKNMTKIDPNLSSSKISKVYAQISDGPNPYSVKAVSSGSVRRARKKSVSPYRSIAEEDARIMQSIEEIKDAKTKILYRENYSEFMKRGAESPALMANAQEIISSAVKITKKTGVTAVGEGCAKFNATASLETLSIKASVDARTVERLVDIDMAGKSVDEVAELVSTARARSFTDTLGYTDDEAIAAVRRLQRKPCKIY